MSNLPANWHEQLARQKLDKAAERLQRAVDSQPNSFEAHRNLGALREQQGRLTEAIACYKRAMLLRPDDADVQNSLAAAMIRDGRFEEAVICCRRALKRRPDFADAHNNLGRARRQQGKLDEAAQSFRQALAIRPDFSEALNNLGVVSTALKSPDEADNCFRRALELRPTTAREQFSLGTQLQEVGDFDGAERCWREALRLDPGHAYSLAELAKLRRANLPAEDLAAARQLLTTPHLTNGQQSALHFGLAHVLDAQADFAAAAEHLGQANSFKQSEHREHGQVYDPDEHERIVAGLIVQFSPAYFARVAKLGVESERPVFVFGMPRSGTTLVEQILAGHSQVFGAGELELANAAFESLPQWTQSGVSAVESVSRLQGTVIPLLARQYLERLSALDDRAARVVDKAPGNYLYLGLLATLFPKARLIHCRRDLRDVALSCWMTDFRFVTWASDFAHIAARIRDYQRIMEHWRLVLPTPILEVDYETMVVDPEPTARRLVEWCGLPWEAPCLEFHLRRHPVRTASVNQVRKPIYRESVGRWMNYQKPLVRLFELL